MDNSKFNGRYSQWKCTNASLVDSIQVIYSTTTVQMEIKASIESIPPSKSSKGALWGLSTLAPVVARSCQTLRERTSVSLVIRKPPPQTSRASTTEPPQRPSVAPTRRQAKPFPQPRPLSRPLAPRPATAPPPGPTLRPSVAPLRLPKLPPPPQGSPEATALAPPLLRTPRNHLMERAYAPRTP